MSAGEMAYQAMALGGASIFIAVMGVVSVWSRKPPK